MAKYFTESEFKKCIPSCSMSDMDTDFMELLDAIREDCGIPLVINCAYRSKEWDKKKGRSGNSAHTTGKAVDVRCNNSATAFKIINSALKLGISRIGLGKGFIHIDNDKNLPQNVFWNYY
jgi:uncharacterized protein YcbK (DUF882 family)